MIFYLIFILFSFIYFFYKFVDYVNKTHRLLNLYKEKFINKHIILLAWQNAFLKGARSFLFLLKREEKILFELKKKGIYVKTETNNNFKNY